MARFLRTRSVLIAAKACYPVNYIMQRVRRAERGMFHVKPPFEVFAVARRRRRWRMDELYREYLAYLRVERGSSPLTVSAYAADLKDYAQVSRETRSSRWTTSIARSS